MPKIYREDEPFVRRLMSAGEDQIKNIAEWAHDFRDLMVCYKCAMMEMETKFNVLDEQFSLQHDRNPISSIKTRLKSPRSIIEKLERRGEPVTLESVRSKMNDVAGVRVVCSFTDDVYRLADALLSQDDVEHIETKDYIKAPKPNGYRSLHLIVAIPVFFENEKLMMRVEIQLRTIAMDCWASLEHQLSYKKDNEFTPESIEVLRECAALSAMLDEKMDGLRQEVLEEDE